MADQRGVRQPGRAARTNRRVLASEYCKEVVEDALRIHGGFGYSTDAEIERLCRDAPMLLIGEGTAEIQKMITGNRLLERYRA